jgi:EAL and modified HD-GYP domain-containing signal transduction protein
MTESTFWGDVALGYSPLIDRTRAVTATRLTVFVKSGTIAPSANDLLDAVAETWPSGGSRVSLNVMSEALLNQLLLSDPQENFMLEVPSFMAADPDNASAINRLHARGVPLLLQGRSAGEMPTKVAHCFKYSVIDVAEDRRLHPATISVGQGTARSHAFVQAGVRSIADMEAAFARGAAGVFGWPIDETVSAGAKPTKVVAPPDLQVIVELINRVDKQESIDRLENTLRRDPTLAFKLIRYINSPTFGLRVEISSFRHAIMMLGYQRLKRWLALLLATAGKDANQRPLMFAAVRRGLLMEELARSSGDEEMRNELFICGVFSLLDRMFRQPFGELLRSIPVPERVFQALVEGTGPYQPYFDLVRAVEGESVFDIRNAAEQLMLGIAEVNHAEMRALSGAGQLD